MADLNQELFDALQSVTVPEAKQDCGCQQGTAGTAENFSDADDLGSALNAALDALQGPAQAEFDALTTLSEDSLAFSDLEQGLNVRLEDILAIVEKYPGLKIAFSY